MGEQGAGWGHKVIVGREDGTLLNPLTVRGSHVQVVSICKACDPASLQCGMLEAEYTAGLGGNE